MKVRQYLIMYCIFCKKPSHSSKSKEHVIPESIGSKKVVLPPGIVCDKCNNYFARKVEAPILNHHSFKNVRAYYRVPNKRGKSPPLTGYIAGTDIRVTLSISKEGKIQIKPEDKRHLKELDILESKMVNKEDFSPLLFLVEITPPEKEMSRFLAKMALEAVAYRFLGSDNFAKLIFTPYFDPIRNYARRGSVNFIWSFHQRTVFPMDTNMRHPDTGEWVHAGFGHDLFLTRRQETYFAFMIYGVEFVINVGGPSIKGYLEWLKENNNISPMIERTGAKLVRKTIDGEDKFYLNGEFMFGSGTQFDIEQMSNEKLSNSES